MKRFLRDNGLTLAFGLLFLGSLVGQAIAGHAADSGERLVRGAAAESFWSYVGSADFVVDVAENWQSEYLQFFLYIVVTVWLIQRGSPESKPPDRIGTESDRDQLVGAYATDRSPRWAKVGGLRTRVYSVSLGLAMAVLFLLSWGVQSVAGTASHNQERLLAFQEPVSWSGYVLSADFWDRSLQNWQSEFLAIASMAALSVYLRQRGSPESKPVGAPHAVTDDSG